jgi:hypothetical protein
MTQRDDREWLLARERGDDISDVPETTRAAYHQLEQLIAALPDPAPPADWKRRTLAALDAPAAPITAPPRLEPRRYRWAAVSGVAALAAAAVVLWFVLGPRPAPPQVAQVAVAAHADGPVVTTAIRPGGLKRSTAAARLGDTLVVTADADAAIELRLYGEADEPVARCNDSEGCAVVHTGAHRHYVLEHVLQVHGTVRVVVFTGTAFPATFESLDADVATAHAYGGSARQIASTVVE